MSDQSLVPSVNETAGRDENGRWLPGHAPNPEGNNGHTTGWQRYSKRVQKWLEMPVEELRRYARSPSEIRKLSGIDAICLRHVLNSMSGFDIRAEREALIDRIEGKAKATTVIQNPDGTPVQPIAILTAADGARAYQDMLKRATDTPAE